MTIAWLTTFNNLRDTALRRLDTIRRLGKLCERQASNENEHAAFATVVRLAQEDHHDAVRALAQHAMAAPTDDLQSLPDGPRRRLAGRVAEVGADEAEATLINAGLALGASPYPLLALPSVVARDDLLDLVLAGCTADGLNDESKDPAMCRTWETVVFPYRGSVQDDEAAWVERLATCVLPRLARAGADLDRPTLGAPTTRPERTTLSAREQRAHVLATALVRYQGEVLHQALPGNGEGEQQRRRL
ncbi:hypothetical protein [Paraburkholderia fungorum]|uniref:hypothetical protein n=1 Tax=Paraburkholderia fungorum TaxID=134537 RepID=UPI003877ADA0